MNYEQMIETLDIIEFQRRKNWYVHESTYDLLIKQLKRCKRLDEGSLLDWVPIYFVTYLFALIVFIDQSVYNWHITSFCIDICYRCLYSSSYLCFLL